jgi:hypothetical protein
VDENIDAGMIVVKKMQSRAAHAAKNVVALRPWRARALPNTGHFSKP